MGVLDELGGVAGEAWSMASACGVSDVHFWEVMRGDGSTRGRALREEQRKSVIPTM